MKIPNIAGFDRFKLSIVLVCALLVGMIFVTDQVKASPQFLNFAQVAATTTTGNVTQATSTITCYINVTRTFNITSTFYSNLTRTIFNTINVTNTNFVNVTRTNYVNVTRYFNVTSTNDPTSTVQTSSTVTTSATTTTATTQPTTTTQTTSIQNTTTSATSQSTTSSSSATTSQGSGPPEIVQHGSCITGGGPGVMNCVHSLEDPVQAGDTVLAMVQNGGGITFGVSDSGGNQYQLRGYLRVGGQSFSVYSFTYAQTEQVFLKVNLDENTYQAVIASYELSNFANQNVTLIDNWGDGSEAALLQNINAHGFESSMITGNNPLVYTPNFQPAGEYSEFSSGDYQGNMPIYFADPSSWFEWGVIAN